MEWGGIKMDTKYDNLPYSRFTHLLSVISTDKKKAIERITESYDKEIDEVKKQCATNNHVYDNGESALMKTCSIELFIKEKSYQQFSNCYMCKICGCTIIKESDL